MPETLSNVGTYPGMPPWMYNQTNVGGTYPVTPGATAFSTAPPWTGIGYANYMQQDPGTYQYKYGGVGIGTDYWNRAQQVQDLFGQIYTGHTDKPIRKMRSWADFYRTGALTSMGMMPGVEGATDPLAQLQQSLMQQYDPTVSQNFGQGADFRNVISQQQRNLGQQLTQRAAAMGTPDLYSGLLGQQARAREALASKAQAAYDPMQWQMSQQLQAQERQTLQAINQADLEARRIGLTSGRST